MILKHFQIFLFFLMIFLEQTFRPTLFIPDACGGRAASSHGEVNPGTQRRGGTFEKCPKTTRTLENGRHLGAPWSIVPSITPGCFPRKKTPGGEKMIFRNVQALGMLCMHNINH
mgnify:CR=1 FL=1